MITLQTVKEEIAHSLLEQLDSIIESGNDELLEEWLSSLTEEQIDILNEQGYRTNRTPGGSLRNVTDFLTGKDYENQSMARTAAGAVADFTPLGVPRAIGRYSRGEQGLGSTAIDVGTAFLGPIAKGAQKLYKAYKGVDTARDVAKAANLEKNLVARSQAIEKGRGTVKKPGQNVPHSGAAAPQTAAQSQQAARGGAVTGGAITQTRPNSIAPRLPAPSNKPAATVPALRPALPSSLRPATSGAPVPSAPSGPPASFTKPSKLGTSVTAAGIGAEVARRSIAPSTPAPSTPAPMPNIPLNRPTQQPAPAAQAQTVPSASAAQPKAVTQTVKPMAKPQPKANMPARKSVQRPAAKPSPSRPTFSTGTSSLGSHMSRSMGGLGEETNFQLKESFETFIRHKYNKRDLI